MSGFSDIVSLFHQAQEILKPAVKVVHDFVAPYLPTWQNAQQYAEKVLSPVEPYLKELSPYAHDLAVGVAAVGILSAARFAARTITGKIWRKPVLQKFVHAEGMETAQRDFYHQLSLPQKDKVVAAQLARGTIEIIDIGGTPFYAYLIQKDNKRFAVMAETLDALRLAHGEDLLFNRASKNVRRAHLVRLLDDGRGDLEQLRDAAYCASAASIVGQNLYVTNTAKGLVYNGTEIKISITEENGRQIARVRYQGDKDAKAKVGFLHDSTKKMRMDVTDIMKVGKLDMLIAALYHTVDTNPVARDRLLANFFERNPSYLAYWLGRHVGDIPAFTAGAFVRIIQDIDPVVLSSRITQHAENILKGEQTPDGFKGLVKESPLNEWGQPLWRIEDGALAQVDALPVPAGLARLERGAHDEMAEFFKHQIFLPWRNIVDGRRAHETGITAMNSAYGITGLLAKEDPAHYVVYDTTHDFGIKNSIQQLSSTTSDIVNHTLHSTVINGNREEHMLAALSLMQNGTRILRYEDGKIFTAPIAQVYNSATGTFVEGYKTAAWTEHKPAETLPIVAAVHARLNATRPTEAANQNLKLAAPQVA